MDEADRHDRARANWALAVLTMIGVCNWVDRTVVSILLEPIKAELHASDTLMGVLIGFGFTLAYAVAAIPLARVADRVSRRNFLAAALTVWSVMTISAGLVRSFGQLLAARALVAVSESAGAPTSQSLLVDFFPPARRPFALGIYSSSIYIATTLSTLVGGWLGYRYGWRVAMVSVSVPGLLLALILLATVREPVRGGHDRLAAMRDFGFGEALAALFASRAFTFTVIAMALGSIINGATLAWTPAFLGRSFALNLKQIGLTLGLVKGLTGIFGVLFGGWLAGRLSGGGVVRQLNLCAGAMALSTPFFLGFSLAPTLTGSLASVAIFQVLVTMPIGVAFAVVHQLSPPRIRALATAVASLGTALLGGAGPLYVGVLNDAFAAAHGAGAIRYAMTLVAPFIVATAIAYWLGARSHRDVAP